MRTVEDVIENMEGGLQFAIQAGVDRANQGLPSTSHFVHRWKVLAAQFSYQVFFIIICLIKCGKLCEFTIYRAAT